MSTRQVPELIGAEAIRRRVEGLAAEVSQAVGGASDLVVIVVLEGARVFAGDLLRALQAHGVRPAVDFLQVSSYGAGTVSSGDVRLRAEPAVEVAGRPVLVVDDVLDTGRSLAFACAWLRARGCGSLRTCVLLDKPARRVLDVRADFVGFEVPDRFVVGYGIDHAERHRELPYVGVIDENIDDLLDGPPRVAP